MTRKTNIIRTALLFITFLMLVTGVYARTIDTVIITDELDDLGTLVETIDLHISNNNETNSSIRFALPSAERNIIIKSNRKSLLVERNYSNAFLYRSFHEYIRLY